MFEYVLIEQPFKKQKIMRFSVVNSSAAAALDSTAQPTFVYSVSTVSLHDLHELIFTFLRMYHQHCYCFFSFCFHFGFHRIYTTPINQTTCVYASVNFSNKKNNHVSCLALNIRIANCIIAISSVARFKINVVQALQIQMQHLH